MYTGVRDSLLTSKDVLEGLACSFGKFQLGCMKKCSSEFVAFLLHPFNKSGCLAIMSSERLQYFVPLTQNTVLLKL